MEQANSQNAAAKAGKQSTVDRAYAHLRNMVMTYQLMPGEKLNERALAMQLNASRTPLREALNRLVSEGLVTSTAREGFACRPLDPKEIYDLYQLRAIIESQGVLLATERATDDEIADLETLLEAAADTDQDAEFVERDIRFHEAIARLSGNAELLRTLQAINTRVYFIRWIDRVNRQQSTDTAHQNIYDAMVARDGAKASEYMYNHIDRRMEHIIDVVRAGFAHLYTEKSVSKLRSAERS